MSEAKHTALILTCIAISAIPEGRMISPQTAMLMALGSIAAFILTCIAICVLVWHDARTKAKRDRETLRRRYQDLCEGDR